MSDKDIELVIKIPEELYNHIMNDNVYFLEDGEKLHDIVKNGIPLPKGHGDLIDRNSILCDDLPCNLCGHTDECFKLLAPTIIEADKAESEE